MLMDEIVNASRAKELELDPFFYSAVFPLALFGVGAVLPINVPINADSDFIMRYLDMAAYSAPGVPLLNPDFDIVIFDSSSGRNLMDQPIHVQTILGTGQLPFILPEPKLIKGGGTLIITLTNNDAVAALVHITLCGFKAFRVSGYNR